MNGYCQGVFSLTQTLSLQTDSGGNTPDVKKLLMLTPAAWLFCGGQLAVSICKLNAKMLFITFLPPKMLFRNTIRGQSPATPPVRGQRAVNGCHSELRRPLRLTL